MYACKLPQQETGYVALGKEGLATASIMEKLHYFLYDRNFTLETNQKPLEENILKRSVIEKFPECSA